MLILSNKTDLIVEQILSLRPVEDEVILLLIAEHDKPDIPALIRELNSHHIMFFGGVFPGLIYSKQHIKKGCIVKKFKALMGPVCITDIESSLFTNFPHYNVTSRFEKGTAIVLLDGLSSNLYLFLEKLNDLLGEQCHFIGGGAGSISLLQQPCIFSSDGFKKDAAVVCVIDKQVSLGVRHGWAQLAGPLVATKTEMNTIIQLNWQNAIDVYNSIIEKDCGIKLNKHNFASIAQGYPFGILREKDDDIVRDPLAIGEGGSIICIGEVPPNTVLHVLKGNPDALLKAAQKAMNDCAENRALPLEAAGTFVVDCITRALFLQEEFEEETDIVHRNLVITKEEQEPFGVLSLGEISSYGEGILELFNKTIVIGTLS